MIPIEVPADCKSFLKLLVYSIKAMSSPISGRSVIMQSLIKYGNQRTLPFGIAWDFLFASGN